MRSSVATGVGITAALALVAAGGGCDSPAPERKEPPKRLRRVIEPPTERFGPLPPYAIRPDGVGPYKIGDKLSDLLERLPSGPRIALFEIPGVVHRNVIRAEDDTILIGGEQASTASFVAVVGADVARTESGIHVGSTRGEVIAALGPPASDPERARDPRLLAPGGAPSLRAVLIEDRVAALVVVSAQPVTRPAADCPRPPSTDRELGACLTATGELIEITDEIVVRSPDGERALAPPLKPAGLVFAAPLRTSTAAVPGSPRDAFRGAEARDELIVITRSDEPAARTWWLSVYRLDGGRLVRAVDAAPLYQLSSANARWIGADLRDVELYLELTSRPDAIQVGGLLTTTAAAKIRDVVVVAPVSIARKRGKPAALEPVDGGSAAPGSAASPSPASAANPRVSPDAMPDGSEPDDPGSEPARDARP